jgi:hypothetical protein
VGRRNRKREGAFQSVPGVERTDWLPCVPDHPTTELPSSLDTFFHIFRPFSPSRPLSRARRGQGKARTNGTASYEPCLPLVEPVSKSPHRVLFSSPSRPLLVLLTLPLERIQRSLTRPHPRNIRIEDLSSIDEVEGGETAHVRGENDVRKGEERVTVGERFGSGDAEEREFRKGREGKKEERSVLETRSANPESSGCVLRLSLRLLRLQRLDELVLVGRRPSSDVNIDLVIRNESTSETV